MDKGKFIRLPSPQPVQLAIDIPPSHRISSNKYIKCRELRQETSVLNAHLFSVEYKRRFHSSASAHKHRTPTVPECNTRSNSGTVTYITISIRGLQYSEVPATVTTALRNQYLLSGTSPSSSADAFVVISAVVHSLVASGTSPL